MAQLSEKYIADGRSFLQALDGAGIVSSAALWLWQANDNAWRYVLSSPLVQQGADMPVKIAAVLATMPAGFAVDRDNLRLYDAAGSRHPDPAQGDPDRARHHRHAHERQCHQRRAHRRCLCLSPEPPRRLICRLPRVEGETTIA